MMKTLSSAVSQLRDGANGLRAMKNLRLVLVAAEMASRERGPSNGILGDDLPHEPQKVALLSKARQKTDTAFAELTTAVQQETGNQSGLSPSLSNAQKQLQLGRTAIDSIAAAPRTQRQPEQIRAAISEMFLVIDDLAPAALQLTNVAQSIYPNQTNFLLAARSAAELREFAGRLGSHFTVALTKRERIEMVELTAIEQLMGRIDQLRSALLERVQARQGDVAVGQATAIMQSRYFENAVPYVREQLAIGLGNADFHTDAAGFAKLYVPDMDSIISLRNTLIDEALRNAQKEQTESRNSAYLIIFWTVASVVLLITILLVLEFRISRPLRRSIQLILDVAHGKLEIKVPKVKYQDELSEVLSAIEVLRDNGLARRQAESLLEVKGLELTQANQALLETAAALESRVAERTIELKNALLAAQSANEAKSRFLALMSHEIRTPMNGVLGLAELMRTTPLDEQQSIYVRNILSAGSALSALINDILDFSKIEAGEMTLEPLVFDPMVVVNETIEFMQLQANEKQLPLQLNVVKPLPARILSDPTRLRQVLLNLIGNAIKFTRKGKVTVSLHSSQSNLVFTVQDSGIGMSGAALAGLFEPFRQADSSTARKFGGTGLGLVICKALVEKMQGQIHVSSIEGQGSTFTVELPMPKDVELTLDPDKNKVHIGNDSDVAEAVDQLNLSALRILLVDDQPINRLMAGSQLKQLGCSLVEEAHNGLQALKLLRSKPFDVVLMDMQMPEMDGLEATRGLRQLTLQSQPIVIAMTANAFSEDREACMDAGMDYFLPKPVKLDALRSAIQQMILARSKKFIA
jgi:signal transduction histidine kinase/ActR/RegA family two-component response regulator